MILDNENQRRFLLEMFQQAQFPGVVLDVALSVRTALMSAKIAEPTGADEMFSQYHNRVPVRPADASN